MTLSVFHVFSWHEKPFWRCKSALKKWMGPPFKSCPFLTKILCAHLPNTIICVLSVLTFIPLLAQNHRKNEVSCMRCCKSLVSCRCTGKKQPCRVVPCRAVPCRAVPCRALPCRVRGMAGLRCRAQFGVCMRVYF